MEKKISVVFMPDFLMAAMEPNRNRFIKLLNAENKDKFGLYFFVDPSQESVDYSLSHKEAFLEGKADYYGDIYKLLLSNSTYGSNNTGVEFLLDTICNRLKKQYYDQISRLSNSDGDKGSPIDITAISHSSLVEKDSFENLKRLLINCFGRNNFTFSFSSFTIPQLLLKYLRGNGQISNNDSNFILIDGLTDNLQLTALAYSENGTCENIGEEKFKNDGLDPRVNIISSSVVRHFDTYYGWSLTEEVKNEFIRKFSSQAEMIIEKLKQEEILSFQCTLHYYDSENNLQIPFDKRIIEELVMKYVDRIDRNLKKFMSDNNLPYQSVEKVIILGDNLNISEFQKHIGFEHRKILYLGSDEVFTGVLKELLVSPGAGKIAVTEVGKGQSEKKTIESTILKTGDEVQFGWIAGDGSYREYKAVYVGNNIYTIKDCINPKGLLTGMTFTASRLELNKTNALIVSKRDFHTGILTILKLLN
jgi:hypothetical protein